MSDAPERLNFSWPEKTELSRTAFRIVRILRRAGFAAYLAGGAVRDALLKRPVQEIDIATAATPSQVEKLFAHTIPTGKKHGTITVRLRERSYEVTTFRVEGAYRRARWPRKVRFVRSVAEDAGRRDFTINALYYDPDDKMVLDYVQGIADLSHRRIALVADPVKRIKEDALRMIRAVRFAAILDFGLSRETRKAIQRHAKLIAKISAERLKQELDRILLSSRASVGLGLLDVVGLLPYVLPEVKALQGVEQPQNQHSEGDVYAHSLLALERFDENYDLPTLYAVLFHDIGKAKTRKIREGNITFYDHQNVGARLAEKICRRIKFSNLDTTKVAWLVKNHMVPFDFKRMKLATRRKWGLNPHFRDLLLLYLADVSASLPPSGRPNLNPEGYRQGLKILKELKEVPMLRKPLVSGREVMRILKIKEGPLVGQILKIIEEQKLAGKLVTKQGALTYLRRNKAKLLKLA